MNDDEVRCPECGRGWPDQPVLEVDVRHRHSAGLVDAVVTGTCLTLILWLAWWTGWLLGWWG